jgi:hypothetical protein
MFKGKLLTRMAVYQSIIADRQASAGDRAYALYRAVRCYATSGYSTCGGVTVPPRQRKAWFQQLKTHYPKSHWAQELQFYW